MTKKLKRLLKKVSVLYISTILILIFFNLIPPENAYAANVLNNPSFTGGTTAWTLTNMSYDSVNYQDSAGSIKATALRKASTSGTAVHDSYTSIASEDTITLSGYWSNTVAGNGTAILSIEIEEQSNPGSWTEIWTTGSLTTTNGWTLINNLDVSSSFGTGSYRIRLRAELDGGAAAGSQSDGWFDNLNLDVVSPNITVGTTGTQKTEIFAGSTNVYMGGAFTFLRDSNSTSVTSITISNTGTVSDTNLTGLILHYKQEATCSTSIPVDATQFNSTPGTFTSSSSTLTGSMTVGTSQVCVYVELDVGSGVSVGETIELQITNPSTDISATLGTVSPATVVAISGTTTIGTAGVLAVEIVDGSDLTVISPSVQFTNAFYNWITVQTTASLGTSTEQIKVSNTSVSHSWTLSMAATNGVSSLWESTGSSYDYKGTQSTGRLLVDPSGATITPGGACTNTGLTLQNSAYFTNVVTSINLITAGETAETDCDWYITGIDLTQDIPPQQDLGEYSLGMTITII